MYIQETVSWRSIGDPREPKKPDDQPHWCPRTVTDMIRITMDEWSLTGTAYKCLRRRPRLLAGHFWVGPWLVTVSLRRKRLSWAGRKYLSDVFK